MSTGAVLPVRHGAVDRALIQLVPSFHRPAFRRAAIGLVGGFDFFGVAAIRTLEYFAAVSRPAATVIPESGRATGLAAGSSAKFPALLSGEVRQILFNATLGADLRHAVFLHDIAFMKVICASEPSRQKYLSGIHTPPIFDNLWQSRFQDTVPGGRQAKPRINVNRSKAAGR